MTNPDETELPVQVQPDESDGAEVSFETFDFEKIDARIHPEAAPHSDHHYRAAGRAFLGFFDQCLAYLLASENPKLAVHVIAIASGRGLLIGGISQVEIAARLGITRAAVSKGVKQFQASVGNDIAGIEPMPGQRTTDSCRKFASVRNQQLKKSK